MGALADLPSRLEAILRLPLHSRIDQIEELAVTLPGKELQGVLPPLLSSIFGVDGQPSWGLRSMMIPEESRLLFDFLSPTGTIFKMCYKLLNDPQLRYNFPLRLLPVDVVHMLESGRISQFYMDLVNMDHHARQIISLSLNAFDYYIFHFAIHLHCTSYNRESWDAWNTVYYELSCEYLLHFLPSDINTIILPQIIDFSGKSPAVSHMQVTNRHTQFPSLLISQENIGCPNIPSANTTQLHPRGEIFRSETVLQVFIDIWLSTASQNDFQQIDGVCHSRSTYPASEHVRIARALIKQCHSFSLGGAGDPTSLGELRRATPGVIAPQAHAHIRHLMNTWPLDSSFRLVLELWFSFIQPWRYIHTKNKKSPMRLDTSLEDHKSIEIDSTFIPFISENLLAYTEIFQLVVPRFLRLNLTVPKNATMLFRLTKVFSQTNLVRLLMEVENSVASDMEPVLMAENSSFTKSKMSQSMISSNSGKMDRSSNSVDSCNLPNTSALSNSGWENMEGVDITNSHQYRPLLLGGGRNMARDLLMYASQAYLESMEILKIREERVKAQKSSILGSIYYWFGGDNSNDDIPLEEMKKVPIYLSTSITQLANIFSLDTNLPLDNETGSFRSVNMSQNFVNMARLNQNALMSPRQAKERTYRIQYMGDPDLQPVKSFECGFIVRILHQISSKINDMYTREMIELWDRDDIVGIFSKEVLMSPCVIHTYSKSPTRDSELVRKNLPPRISLRYFASYVFLFWFVLCFTITYLFGYGTFSFLVVVIIIWLLPILFNTLIKWLTSFNSNRI